MISSLRDWCLKQVKQSGQAPPALEPESELRGSFLEQLPSSDPRPDGLATRQELRVMVTALPPEQRTLTVRLYWQDSTEAQEAKALGVSQFVINRRKHAILCELRTGAKINSGFPIDCVPKAREYRALQTLARHRTGDCIREAFGVRGIPALSVQASAPKCFNNASVPGLVL